MRFVTDCYRIEINPEFYGEVNKIKYDIRDPAEIFIRTAPFTGQRSKRGIPLVSLEEIR